MGGSRSIRLVALSAACIGGLLTPASASAEVQPFGMLGCVPDGDIRICEGSTEQRIPSFDGLPIYASVYLPAHGGSNLPLVIMLGGYPQRAIEPDQSGIGTSPRSLASRGYAVLTFDGRGTFDSCGLNRSSLSDPVACVDGYTHVADSRYEVRDSQHLAGLLADEGLIDPRRIGVIGESYGGGQALQLAILRDRIRLPDGSYAPWLSPERELPMRVAAAVPLTPWADLAYSLAPNGRTIDYLRSPRSGNLDPIGIVKTSFFAAELAVGANAVYQPPPGLDPGSDLIGWHTGMAAGEPYAFNPIANQFTQEVSANHSADGLELAGTPAPTLIASGFSDDLFPVEEALRHINRVRAAEPRAVISQFYGDFGHLPAQNEEDVLAALHARTIAWMDRYVKGADGRRRGARVVAYLPTCPRDQPIGERFRAPTWPALHPGEVSFFAPETAQVSSTGGDPGIAASLDPIAGSGRCSAHSAAPEEGTANYRLPAVDVNGYTLLGSPTVIARIATTGADPADAQLAARLWDIAPDGSSQRLVTRTLYRPAADGRQVFQLHANGYRFEPGHVPSLQLLGSDPPYGRPSNGSFKLTISDLELRLPVAESPGGQVGRPARPFVPAGARLAPGYPSKPRRG